MIDIETVRKFRKVLVKVYEDAGCEYTKTEEEMLAEINDWEKSHPAEMTEGKHDCIG